MNQKHLLDRYFHLGLAIIATLSIVPSCKQRSEQNGMNESAFVFETANIKGNEADYTRPAVITGHITNREVYPKTTEVSIVIPFYDRVSTKQTSAIYDDSFAFSFVPYAPRTVSMPPYIDHLMVCPGDSIHVELDFADLAKVAYSGEGAQNNEHLNEFFVRYYLKDWPGFSEWELDSEGEPYLRKYEHADAFVEATRQKKRIPSCPTG